MEFTRIECPCCGGKLECEDGLDTFFCKYCGSQLMLEGQSASIVNAKVKIKKLEHEERMADKQFAQDRYMAEREDKKEKSSNKIALLLLLLPIIASFLYFSGSANDHKRTVNNLNTLYEEAESYIIAGDYDNALLTANQIILDDHYSTEEEKAWDEKRKNLIKMIKEKQAEAIRNNPDNIFVHKSSKYCGKHHSDIVSELENSGFKNIKEIELKEKPGLLHSKGDVDHITINGISDFKENTYFNVSDEVVLYYYAE